MRSVGRYEILEEIGRGGMGAVYLARQHDLDRLVALKALHSVHLDATESVERFVRESRLAGSLNHPNIVTVYEYFEHDRIPYIAMEYVPRGSLRWWTGRLSLAQLAGALEGLLAGLAAVEPTGIVHRDLKPENVMVSADGLVKITDFGIAKATERTGAGYTSLATSGVALGTPAYMAPEQALSQEIGPWTDLYSVGIMAYEQLVGHVPFHDSHAPMAILLRHVNEPIPPVIEKRKDVDPLLSAWVARLLAKDPVQRTRRATQAWEELEEIILGLLTPRWRRDARLAGPDRAVKAPSRPSMPSESRWFQTAATSQTRPRAPEQADHTIRPPHTPLLTSASEQSWSAAVGHSLTQRARVTPRDSARLGVAVFGVAVIALLGFLLAPGGGGAAAVDRLGASAHTPSLKVSFPTSWQVSPRTMPTPAIELREPIALISSYKGGALVIGWAQATSSTLLPARLLSALPASPHGEAVSLGGTDFYRYRNLQTRGSTGSETVYAKPTTAGIVLGICTFPTAHAAVVNSDCERILGSLVLSSARPLALGPNSAYSATLTGSTSELNRARSRFGAALADASTATAQASNAERLARAYRRAAQNLRRAIPGPSEQTANAALTAALTNLARGYTTVAAGARSENLGEFNSGRHAVDHARATLAAAVAQFAELGYRFDG